MASPRAARSSGVYSRFDDTALPRHHRVTRSEVAPPRCQGEIVAGHVAAAGRGRYGDGADLWKQRALGNAGHRRVGIEQACEFPAARR